MLKIRYAKNTYGLKCQNTHGPKLWLLDTWTYGPMALGPWAHGHWLWAAAGEVGGTSVGRAAAAQGQDPWAHAHLSRSPSFGP